MKINLATRSGRYQYKTVTGSIPRSPANSGEFNAEVADDRRAGDFSCPGFLPQIAQPFTQIQDRKPFHFGVQVIGPGARHHHEEPSQLQIRHGDTHGFGDAGGVAELEFEPDSLPVPKHQQIQSRYLRRSIMARSYPGKTGMSFRNFNEDRFIVDSQPLTHAIVRVCSDKRRSFPRYSLSIGWRIPPVPAILP